MHALKMLVRTGAMIEPDIFIYFAGIPEVGGAQNSSQVSQFALHTMPFFSALAQFALRSMPVFSALAQFALRSMPVFSALAQFAFANR